MFHSSRILSAYLLLFLFVVAVFSTGTNLSVNTSYLVLPLLIVLLFFWKVKAVRYLAIFCLVLTIAHTRVQEQKPGLVTGGYKGEVVIVNEPKISGNDQKFIVKNLKSGEMLEIITNQFPEYGFGDGLLVEGVVKNADTSKYLKSGLSGVLVFPKVERVNLSLERWEVVYFGVRKFLIGLKNNCEERISLLIPEPEAGLLAGIILGSKADLSPALLSDLSRTGTMHIVALSGFNITILAEFIRLLTRNFSRKISTIFPLLIIWSFVLATGFSASIVRAAIMGSLVILGQFMGRKSDSLVAILIASAIMVYLNPNILLYDIGFQLSFAATFGILFFVPRIEKYFSLFGAYLGPIFATTVAAQLFTWPITSYYFGNVSLIAPIVNLFILPFIPFVMLIGFMSVVASFLSVWLAAKIALVTWAMLAYFLKAITIFSDFSWAAINYNVASSVFMLGYYLILFDVCIFLGRRSNEKASA